MSTKYKMTMKDGIILMLFVVLIVLNAVIYIWQNGFVSMGGMIEQTLLLMLTFVTLVDIASYVNWSILVPDFFEAAKEKKYRKDVQICVDTYLKEDVNFLQDYNQERISFIMSQLGIGKDQFDKIRLELIKMRCVPLKTLADAKKKIECLVCNDDPIIIDQDTKDSRKLCYNKVKYYVNIMDIMFIPDYASELSSILSFLILEKIDLSGIDKLIIPQDSNFLLGVEVGRRLGKSVVKMRYNDGKILKEQPWDGNLKITDRVIIIHDVLVTGEQIKDTISKLPKTCTIVGFFCLIARKEWNGKDILLQKDIPCYEVIEMDDEYISELRRKKTSKE